MVAHEADGNGHRVLDVGVGEAAQHIADIGREPGIVGLAAPALIGDLPAPVSETPGDDSRGRLELARIRRVLGHGHGNAVRGEDEQGIGPLG